MQHLEAGRLSELIPPHDWDRCRPIIRRAADEGISCALGGGLAFSFYSCRRRNTKDVDLLVKPQDKDRFVQLLSESGFEDYHDQLAYDRSWIYRGYRDGVLVDIIWTLPNHRFEIDNDWFWRGNVTSIHGQEIRLITIEDLMRVKLYVLQRDRTDWPDVMNLIYQQAENIQWRTLVCLLGDDAPLLAGLLRVYEWIEPEGARRIPNEVWPMLGLKVPVITTIEEDRKFLLDTNNWFGPTEDIATC